MIRFQIAHKANSVWFIDGRDWKRVGRVGEYSGLYGEKQVNRCSPVSEEVSFDSLLQLLHCVPCPDVLSLWWS